MVKNILKSALAFLGAFFLFAVLANGMNFLLIDSLFAFSGYPRFPATPANPLYVLFPLVFMFFSFPALTLISVQRQFSLKKRFLLLLESHAFFFFLAGAFLERFLLFHTASGSCHSAVFAWIFTKNRRKPHQYFHAPDFDTVNACFRILFYLFFFSHHAFFIKRRRKKIIRAQRR